MDGANTPPQPPDANSDDVTRRGAENAPGDVGGARSRRRRPHHLYNLAYLLYTFNQGGAILSAFAVAFGVYIAIFEWRLLQQLRPVSANR